MSVHANGYWFGISQKINELHCFDQPLSLALVDFFQKENVSRIVDLGCGMGEYVQMMNENNIICDGFDGNPETEVLTQGRGKVLDLSVPIIFPKKYDWVMSLEVGEHLPQKFEDIFIQNLHDNNISGMVISWAVKGQGGFGHFNEQNNDYIKEKICKLGYSNDLETEKILRDASSLRWFKNTVMVFRKVKN